MKVKELIDKLSKYNPDIEIALGDLQNDCFDKDISIMDDSYRDMDNELIFMDNYDDYEWEVLNSEREISRILLLV